MTPVNYYYENMPTLSQQQPSLDLATALSRYTDTSAGLTDVSGMKIAQPNGPQPWWSGALNSSSMDPRTGAVTQTQGWGMPALGAAQGVFNAWLGMKQYNLAKDQLAQSKQQFNLNYDAQRTATNAQLRDRQMARVASNPGAYQSVGDYMSLNGIGGR